MYSKAEGVKRAGIRAGKIGLVVIGVEFLASIISLITTGALVIPAEYQAIILPSIAALAGFLEKLERNYRETK